MDESLFIELSYIIIIAVIIAGIAKLLKQPLIIAYIATGIIVSPYVLNIVKSTEAINTFSQLGISLLLFMVGLSLNPKIIKHVGKISLITGVGQVLFTSSIGFTIAMLFNFSIVEAMYIGIALAFSSTIVIMKLLSDKKDVETLYGRISIGFLIVQDIIVMMMLIFIVSMGTTKAGGETALVLLESVIKGSGLIAGTLLAGYYILPYLTRKIADYQELLILFSIAWCFALATIFHSLGLSIEIGALLAGVSLSISPFRHDITAKVKPLRDFFILMFFVFLGTQMEFKDISEYTIPIIVFSMFVLIGNPLIVLTLMGTMGYSKRNGFLAGLTVAQISEFSLILIALGISVGHLNPEILSLITIVGLITIGGSTYFIMHGKKIFKYIGKYLSIFEKKGKKVDEHMYDKKKNYDVILIGYEHLGKNLIPVFQNLNMTILLIDYDPTIINKIDNENIDFHFGDAEDPDILEGLNIKNQKLIISSLKSAEINLEIVKKIRAVNQECIVIILSEERENVKKLYKLGATYVVMPDFLSSHHAANLIEDHGIDIEKFLNEKLKHMKRMGF